MALTISSLASYLIPPTSTIGREFRNSAPWVAILSLHTTKLYIPIPKLLDILPTFMVLYLVFFLVPNPSTIGRTAQTGGKWISILSILPILFSISALHSLIQIQILQTALNLVMQLSLVRLFLHWLRFYYIILKTKHNQRSIWNVITKLVPNGVTKALKPYNRIFCSKQNFCCFSFYQTQGSYAHLDQRS